MWTVVALVSICNHEKVCLWQQDGLIKTFLAFLECGHHFLIVWHLVAAVFLGKPAGSIQEDTILNRKSQEARGLKEGLRESRDSHF